MYPRARLGSVGSALRRSTIIDGTGVDLARLGAGSPAALTTVLIGTDVLALGAAIFFALFAFALNNAQPATVHLFFGAQWVAPMVLVVLLAFAAMTLSTLLNFGPSHALGWLTPASFTALIAGGLASLALATAPRKVAAGIGRCAPDIVANFNDAPLTVESGRFVHVTLQVPIGTATASQVIRGDVQIYGYFEQ